MCVTLAIGHRREDLDSRSKSGLRTGCGGVEWILKPGQDFFLIPTQGYVLLISQRGNEGREKHQCERKPSAASCMAAQVWKHKILSECGDQTCNLYLYEAMLQPAEPPGQGTRYFLFRYCYAFIHPRMMCYFPLHSPLWLF